MGTYVCQKCEEIIGHFEDEKVSVLYVKCDCGKHCEHHDKNEKVKQ